MAKLLIESMIDVLYGGCYPAKTGTWHNVVPIPEERIFIREGIETIPILRMTRENIEPRRINRIVSDEWKTTEPKNNAPKILNSLYCCNRLIHSNFIPAYKYVKYRRDETKAYKWEKDGNVYYISENMIFNSQKRLILSIEYTGRNSSKLLRIERSCIGKGDYMSKFIYNTFIPAFINAFSGPVFFDDMSDCTMKFNNKYLNYKNLNKTLNKKLHDLVKISDFS